MGLQQPPERLDLGEQKQYEPSSSRQHELQQTLETEQSASSSSDTDKQYARSPAVDLRVSLETCSIYYVAGYLMYKILNKYTCEMCENTLSEFGKQWNLTWG